MGSPTEDRARRLVDRNLQGGAKGAMKARVRAAHGGLAASGQEYALLYGVHVACSPGTT
jgi:hypothetical protein